MSGGCLDLPQNTGSVRHTKMWRGTFQMPLRLRKAFWRTCASTASWRRVPSMATAVWALQHDIIFILMASDETVNKAHQSSFGPVWPVDHNPGLWFLFTWILTPQTFDTWNAQDPVQLTRCRLPCGKKLNDSLHIETAYNKNVYTSVSSFQSLQGANVLLLFLDLAF